jgi:hypothetical protein
MGHTSQSGLSADGFCVIAGVAPRQIFEAIIASAVALVIFGIPSAIKQHKYSPILKRAHEPVHLDWARIAIVGLILTLALATNLIVNTKFPEYSDRFPFIGLAVWVGDSRIGGNAPA